MQNQHQNIALENYKNGQEDDIQGRNLRDFAKEICNMMKNGAREEKRR